MSELQPLAHFIGGAFRPSASDATLSSVNPSNPTDVVAEVPEGVVEDLEAAVSAAADALPAWRSATGPARAEVLHRWSGVIAGRLEELAQAMAREVGKPIGEARGEAARAVAILRYYAGEAVREIGEVIPSQLPETLQLTLREPLGVVGLITPWNFPLAIPLWKAAPALAFGNTVVLKPAEVSSGVAALLAETAQAAELPPGIFNLVHGLGATIGAPLAAHEQVRGISFTGSAAVGAQVAEVAARRNVRYQTEMGGKNAAIVLADADLDKAAALTAGGAMRFAGQKCTATSRVIVERSVWDRFLPLLAAQIAALPLGPVTDAAAAIGPVIAERTRLRITSLLDPLSCEVFAGGANVSTHPFDAGYYFAPTVVLDPPRHTALWRDEIFGPLLVAVPVDDPDEAIALANDTPFGLSASLFTRDLRRALQYVRRIEAGMVRVNGDTTGVDPHAPFGGVKGSSSGSREQGPAAREFYTEIRTVQISGM